MFIEGRLNPTSRRVRDYADCQTQTVGAIKKRDHIIGKRLGLVPDQGVLKIENQSAPARCDQRIEIEINGPVNAPVGIEASEPGT